MPPLLQGRPARRELEFRGELGSRDGFAAPKLSENLVSGFFTECLGRQSASLESDSHGSARRNRTACPWRFMSKEVLCSQCGQRHSLESTELVFNWPDEIFSLTEEERAQRCTLGAELCALDRERFFLRGLLALPVKGRSVPYRIGVWAEITLMTYQRIYELWSDPDQSNEPRLAATLANRIPLHQSDSRGLAISIQLTGPTTRPEYVIDAVDHTLYGEQHDGIDEHRALEYSDWE